KALPDLLEAEFTAKMEAELDKIAEGKNSWQSYLTTWNESYFVPALSKAKTVVINSGNTGNNHGKVERKYESSKTKCPECSNFLAKIPSSKVKKKYFLKCVSGCENIVLFWSDFHKRWEAPKTKTSADEKTNKSETKLTSYPCPVCKKPLEEYSYIKDGENKTMLRCSGQDSWKDKKHKDAAYFHTAKGWWSPKFGNLII
ncbi:MAG: DNA topoisomerase I, partial [Sphaerospermopsis kisseleviana]